MNVIFHEYKIIIYSEINQIFYLTTFLNSKIFSQTNDLLIRLKDYELRI